MMAHTGGISVRRGSRYRTASRCVRAIVVQVGALDDLPHEKPVMLSILSINTCRPRTFQSVSHDRSPNPELNVGNASSTAAESEERRANDLAFTQCRHGHIGMPLEQGGTIPVVGPSRCQWGSPENERIRQRA